MISEDAKFARYLGKSCYEQCTASIRTAVSDKYLSPSSRRTSSAKDLSPLVSKPGSGGRWPGLCKQASGSITERQQLLVPWGDEILVSNVERKITEPSAAVAEFG